MADETNVGAGAPKLKIDVKGAQKQAQQAVQADARAITEAETQKTYREARWRQLFTAALEGASVGLIDDLEVEDEDESEPGDEPIPSIEAQVAERAALTANAAAALADFALAIEIQRGFV